jgi:hypothetical protein
LIARIGWSHFSKVCFICMRCVLRLYSSTCIAVVEANSASHSSSMAFSCAATTASSETRLVMPSTLESKEHIEDPIACITSTAEQIAAFKDSISACKSTNQKMRQRILFPEIKSNDYLQPNIPMPLQLLEDG